MKTDSPLKYPPHGEKMIPLCHEPAWALLGKEDIRWAMQFRKKFRGFQSTSTVFGSIFNFSKQFLTQIL